ncbi:MAG: pyruvate, phosphate dikinase, partial [Actinomycetes bacterium]
MAEIRYVFDFTEGGREQKDLLGGKGANLAEMTRLGLPVPPGFTITTDACRWFLLNNQEPANLRVQVTAALRRLEDQLNRRLGDVHDPLLVSVRSGAVFSMPGMMDTILNVGLNDASVKGLVAISGDARFAWDSYRRLISMFGRTVLGVEPALFANELEAAVHAAGVQNESALEFESLQALVEKYKAIIREQTGREFPQHPREQLDLAVHAVFESWNGDRAKLYRRRERIPNDLGTAVNVCTMVFGNQGEDSGTGVAFTRDPATGSAGHYGDYLPNAQGEDVVAGIRNTLTLADLAVQNHEVAEQLSLTMRRLETHYRDLCDIEFTVERGKLWMLQTRVGKRTSGAAFRIACEFLDEGLITEDEALARVSGAQLTQLLVPQLTVGTDRTVITKGIAASPGAAVGQAVFDPAVAVHWAESGRPVVLVRRETNPDDLAGMVAAVGILTSRGGKTSHAAVVARGMGKPAVCGADALVVDEAGGFAVATSVDGTSWTIREGDFISLDGATGEVFLGELPVSSSPVVRYLLEGVDAVLASLSEDDAAVVSCVDRLLKYADKVRRLRVRANADTPDDAIRARLLGAEGIG